MSYCDQIHTLTYVTTIVSRNLAFSVCITSKLRVWLYHAHHYPAYFSPWASSMYRFPNEEYVMFLAVLSHERNAYSFRPPHSPPTSRLLFRCVWLMRSFLFLLLVYYSNLSISIVAILLCRFILSLREDSTPASDGERTLRLLDISDLSHVEFAAPDSRNIAESQEPC